MCFAVSVKLGIVSGSLARLLSVGAEGHRRWRFRGAEKVLGSMRARRDVGVVESLW